MPVRSETMTRALPVVELIRHESRALRDRRVGAANEIRKM